MTFGSGVIMSVADGTCLNATCADFSAAACYPLPFTACGDGADPSVQWVHDANQVFRSVAHNGSAFLVLSGGKGVTVGLYRCDDGAAQTWGVQAGQITTLAEPPWVRAASRTARRQSRRRPRLPHMGRTR